jgi:cell division inhibitor SulA
MAAVPGSPVRNVALRVAANAANGASSSLGRPSPSGWGTEEAEPLVREPGQTLVREGQTLVWESFLVPPGRQTLVRESFLAPLAPPGRWILYIEEQTAPDFYPPAAAQWDVPLGRLIVVRTRGVFDALWVCEQALRCGAVAAVVLSLRHLESHVSRRLQLAAEAGGGLALLIRTEDRAGHTFAASRLRIEPVPVAADTEARRVRISVLKLREGRPPPPFEMDLYDAPDALPAHAVSVDRPRAARQRTAG